MQWHTRCLKFSVKTAVQPATVLRQYPAKRALTSAPRWNLTRLRSLSVRTLILSTACALLSTVSSQAQSRLLTLAMLRPDDLPVRRVSIVADRLVIDTAAPAPAPVQPVSTTSESLSLLTAEKFVLSIRSVSEWRRDPPAGNAFSLSRISLRDLGRPNTWAYFQAGYGQLFNDKTPVIYGRNGAWFEEPSCGYFRICFSF